MLNDLLRFDVKEKSWGRAFTTGQLPPPRYHHSAVVHGSSMFIFGGYTGDLHSNSNLRNQNDLWEYKFDTTQWIEMETSGEKPVPRSAHGAAVYEDHLYVFAGYDGNARLKDMWRIRLSNCSKWEAVQYLGDAPPTSCNFPVAVARNSMYVFSGQTGARVTNSLFRFHFSSSTWSRISIEHVLRDSPLPPTRRYGHSMVAYNSQLYVFGGAADNILPNELHRFDLDDETWSIILPQAAEDAKEGVPSGRLFHAATIVNDAMFIFGGTVDNNTRSGEMFRFQLAAFPRCTLREDIARLLTSPLAFTSDLQFLLGPGQVAVNAHVAIVAARCEWLRQRIRSAKSDPSNGALVQVKLLEAEPQPFQLVLDYIYSDRIDPTQGHHHEEVVHIMMKVYTLSITFQMARLEKLCIRYLETSVNLDNVLDCLKLASSLSLSPVKEYCLKFIIKEYNYNHIVMSSAFESLDQPLMVEVIRRRQMMKDVSVPEARQGMSKDQLQPSSLQDDLRRFLQENGQEFSDVQLVLEGHKIPCHRAILAARSSYFEGLFRSFNPGPGSSQEVPISIGDLLPSKQSFSSLLRYIYCGDVTMPPEDSLYLFTAHAFYIFANNRLQVYCKHNLERNVTTENVIQIVEAADKSQTQDMKNYALDLIVKNFPRVARQPQLKHLSQSLLLDILNALADKMAVYPEGLALDGS